MPPKANSEENEYIDIKTFPSDFFAKVLPAFVKT